MRVYPMCMFMCHSCTCLYMCMYMRVSYMHMYISYVYMHVLEEMGFYISRDTTCFVWILNSWFRASWFIVNKKVQLNATVCRHLFTAGSLYMFRASQHPSSGALNTVSPTSGIGHDTGTATSFQRGLIRPLWKEVAVPVSWPIPEVADTVFSAPDDGCCDARNM